MLRYLVSAIALAALVGCSTGETPANTTPALSSAASATTATGAVGQPVPVSWDKGNGTVTIHTVSRVQPEYGTDKNPAGYLALDVTYTVETGTASYGPLYWKVRDASGHEYDFEMGPEPRLKSGELATGETVRGWLAFDVPTDNLTVFLDDFDGHLATWPITAD